VTALSSNFDAQRKDGLLLSYGVEESTVVYKNGLVCANSGGYVQPGADISGMAFVGVAYEKCDNSSGIDGEHSLRIWKNGSFIFNAGFTVLQSHIGDEVYIADDNTVNTTSTNLVKCGVIVEVISSSKIRVRIDNYTM